MSCERESPNLQIGAGSRVCVFCIGFLLLKQVVNFHVHSRICQIRNTKNQFNFLSLNFNFFLVLKQVCIKNKPIQFVQLNFKMMNQQSFEREILKNSTKWQLLYKISFSKKIFFYKNCFNRKYYILFIFYDIHTCMSYLCYKL